jgi:ATP-dependent helicase HrpA
MNSPAAPATLPIYEKRDEIVAAIRASQVVIVAGETGSGKTTQLPLLCLEAGSGRHGKIGITQPRRIAATSVASYVASQLGCGLGSFVGYKVRFNDKESSATKIKFMTDGILLRELQADRFLERYDAVIIDEVHERSLNIDFLIGYIKRLLPRRPDLRVLLSSATIDTSLFSAAFNNAPVITVAGRPFSIDILYHPLETSDDKGASFVDAAAGAAQELLESSDAGDILVFMPTERDIIETRDLLRGRVKDRCLVLPLFGRMPLSEQAAVFGRFDKRKIVIATNIAETSVTVPNIRFVVDPGLARVKRYDQSAGITRLAVEPISQASARQRSGRCGRVQDGMCVRLYAEEDLLSRPAFTPPEIQRANLGQVILSMASLGLGPVEDFPFLERPSRQAVSQGYRSLVELGALDESRNLTATGRHMSRFPLDPALSRMIIEAHRLQCMGDLLVIASGLCVQDMRVRPPDKRELADAAHARFCDPLSDFLFYMKLWDGCGFSSHENMSLARLKKFCKEHFLSFARMREWRDVHDQLSAVIPHAADRTPVGGPATYEQIHRSIAAGFISHIGRKNEDGSYHIAKGRTSTIFPGSSLYKKKPDWIVSCELVETSRVYSRTCASIDPLWLESLAPHLCKHRYSEPFFDGETGGVKAKETVTLLGLTIIAGRTVGYGRINPREATDVFIREGLCAGRLISSHRFYTRNRELYERIESFQKKIRACGVFAGCEAMLSFYKARLECVTSVHELNALIHKRGSDEFLVMKDSDVLLGNRDSQAGLFPDAVTIGNAGFPILYEFDPSSELDGAAVRVPSSELALLNETVFDWVVPGLYEPRIRFLLESLQKSIKHQGGSVSEMAHDIASSLVYTGEDFLESVCKCATELHGISVGPQSLPISDLPPHLMVKVIVEKGKGRTSCSNGESWKKSEDKWAKTDIRSWDFGDLPRKVEMIRSDHGFPVFGYPSLLTRDGRVDCVVFTSPEEQSGNHSNGVRRLAEICLEKDLAWLEKNLMFDRKLVASIVPQDKAGRLTEILCSLVTDHCFSNENLSLWKKSSFDLIIKKASTELSAQGKRLREVIPAVLSTYFELRSLVKAKLRTCNSKSYLTAANELQSELRAYLDRLFDKTLNFDMLMQYPRYLKAFAIRIQRVFSDLGKYSSRYREAMPYFEKSRALFAEAANYSPEDRNLALDFAMMVEEFKISLFAQQEIKTIFPVSQKRLDEKLAELKNHRLI